MSPRNLLVLQLIGIAIGLTLSWTVGVGISLFVLWSCARQIVEADPTYQMLLEQLRSR